MPSAMIRTRSAATRFFTGGPRSPENSYKCQHQKPSRAVGIKADLGNVGWIVFLGLTDLGVHHIGALEEFGLGRPRHEAGHRNSGVLHLVAERERKRVDKGFRAIVDRLVV